MRYNASILRDRIDLVTVAPVHQGGGNYKEDEEPVRENVPAQVAYQKGSEAVRAGRVEAAQPAVVVMRYRDGVTTDHRLKHNGSTLFIHSVTRVDGQGQASDRGRWLQIVVTKNG